MTDMQIVEENGEFVPLLGMKMAEDKLKSTVIKGGSL